MCHKIRTESKLEMVSTSTAFYQICHLATDSNLRQASSIHQICRLLHHVSDHVADHLIMWNPAAQVRRTAKPRPLVSNDFPFGRNPRQMSLGLVIPNAASANERACISLPGGRISHSRRLRPVCRVWLAVVVSVVVSSYDFQEVAYRSSVQWRSILYRRLPHLHQSVRIALFFLVPFAFRHSCVSIARFDDVIVIRKTTSHTDLVPLDR